jgi:hypothetical protein
MTIEMIVFIEFPTGVPVTSIAFSDVWKSDSGKGMKKVWTFGRARADVQKPANMRNACEQAFTTPDEVFSREDDAEFAVGGRKKGHRSRDEKGIMEGVNRDSQSQRAGRKKKCGVPWGSAGLSADGVPEEQTGWVGIRAKRMCQAQEIFLQI